MLVCTFVAIWCTRCKSHRYKNKDQDPVFVPYPCMKMAIMYRKKAQMLVSFYCSGGRCESFDGIFLIMQNKRFFNRRFRVESSFYIPKDVRWNYSLIVIWIIVDIFLPFLMDSSSKALKSSETKKKKKRGKWRRLNSWGPQLTFSLYLINECPGFCTSFSVSSKYK